MEGGEGAGVGGELGALSPVKISIDLVSISLIFLSFLFIKKSINILRTVNREPKKGQ